MIAWNNRWNCLVLASSEFHWYWIVYVASVSETSGGCGNSDCGYWGTSLGHGSVCGLKNEWNMVYLLTQIVIVSLVNIC